MAALLATIGIFSLSFVAMAIGVIVKNRALQGSCGGSEIVTAEGEVVSCGVCARKQATVCPSDDPLVQIAQLGHPDPDHHRPAVYQR
jgi:hypothetical protein